MVFIEFRAKSEIVYWPANKIASVSAVGNARSRVFHDDGKFYDLEQTPSQFLQKIGQEESEPWSMLGYDVIDSSDD